MKGQDGRHSQTREGYVRYSQSTDHICLRWEVLIMCKVFGSKLQCGDQIGGAGLGLAIAKQIELQRVLIRQKAMTTAA